jgi:O-antigen ligase
MATPIGTVGNSNHVGCYLLFPIFALMGLCFILRGKYRIIPAVALAVVFGAFLLTRARASWLAFGLTLPIALCLLTRTKKVLIATIMCVTFAVAVAWTMFPNSFLKWTETQTLKERHKYFQASYHLWMKSPLFGTGLWSYRNMVYEAQAELQEADNTYFSDYLIPKPRRVHNDYLEILNDGGLLAAILLSLFLYSRMQNAWKVWNRERVKSEGQSTKRYIAATLFSTMVAVMIGAFFFFPFRIVVTLTLSAIILGAMEGLYCREFSSAYS